MNRDRTQVKLCDFGVSNKVESTRHSKAAMAGSIRFMPPEQLDEQLNTKIDVWALGCILLQMVAGRVPYWGIQNDF
jgi:serine/threonine protein kinase